MMPTMTFGQRIKHLRKTKNLSQRELADRIATRLRASGKGFDVTYLSKIENDRIDPPSAAAIVVLAEELGGDSDELLALAKKAPRDIGETLQKSEGARVFFRQAVNLQLSEDEWQQLLENLRELKDGE